MRQVKFFKSVESELLELENEINSWIADEGVDLVSITGNIAPQTTSGASGGLGTFSASDVLVIVVYESK